jgi:predicted nucleotidyltransferase
MPMMYGFGAQRRQMLEAELQRLVDEMPQLGMTSMFLVGPFARGEVGPGSVLDLIVVQETDEPIHRRSDFWTTHLRPRIGINFYVYTQDEFENPQGADPLLHDAANIGERVYG